MKTIEQIEKEVKTIINECKVSYAEIIDITEVKVEIHLSYGDWKEHRRLKNKMQSHNYLFADELITEEDGSDCYSSIHLYEVPQGD